MYTSKNYGSFFISGQSMKFDKTKKALMLLEIFSLFKTYETYSSSIELL